MTLQEMAEIAARYLTRMADAMLRACVERALETGELLRVPDRARRHGRGTCEGDLAFEEWRLMVEGNTDTRWCHQ